MVNPKKKELLKRKRKTKMKIMMLKMMIKKICNLMIKIINQKE